MHKIHPSIVPRPDQSEDFYINEHGGNVFPMDLIPSNVIPFSNSFYQVKETQNSSIRLIRPTMHILPADEEILNKTNLPFGFYIQPFCENNADEKEVAVHSNECSYLFI